MCILYVTSMWKGWKSSCSDLHQIFPSRCTTHYPWFHWISEQIQKVFRKPTNFVRRQIGSLCLRTGKVTSPSRSSEHFIFELVPLIMRHLITNRNVVVFDETIIYEIDSWRNSTSGTINGKLGEVIESITHFYILDNSTPFIFYIKKGE